jgi:hypothetical protein
MPREGSERVLSPQLGPADFPKKETHGLRRGLHSIAASRLACQQLDALGVMVAAGTRGCFGSDDQSRRERNCHQYVISCDFRLQTPPKLQYWP